MTLDEAIKHAEEVAEEQEIVAEIYAQNDGYLELECLNRAEEHRQLAEWLKELKRLREQTEKRTEKRTKTHACDTKTHACDCISRQAAIDKIQRLNIPEDMCVFEIKSHIEVAIAILPPVEPEKCGDIGEISDGYHTFNQLYHQRAILFAAIVNQNTDISWKSYKHSDGKYCFDSNGEWFIVGVDTPEGSYTYHYSKEYWDYFKCKELYCGKEWDGHTEEDVTRLLSLDQQPCGDCISRQAAIDGVFALCDSSLGEYKENPHIDAVYEMLDSLQSVEPERKPGHWERDQRAGEYVCSECGCNPIYERTAPDVSEIDKYRFCRWCGAPMDPKVSTKEVIDEFIKRELKGDTDGQS